MRFDEYNFLPEIKENLKLLGFTRPTDIQHKCITPIQKGEDVLAIAQTGTGKTAAFAIPLIHKIAGQKKISAKKNNQISVLVMVPTRELSLQITEVFKQIAKNTKVKIMSVYGGVDQEPQKAQLGNGMDILISTPGRLFDLVNQGDIHLDKLKTLVLDEADQMLALGFYKDITDLMRHIPKNRQTLFFSATINKEIKKLAYSLVKDAIRIQISPKDPVTKNVTHQLLFVEMDAKRFFLQRLIEENPDLKFLIFVRTKVRAERVFAAMERVGIKTETIHGSKDQRERELVLDRFKKGENKILIATDVTARGIDIPMVDYVVNYDLPDKAENYVHRVGRSGRGKNKGLALSFCAEEEKPLLAAIEEFTTVPIARAYLSTEEYTETIEFADESINDWKSLMNQEIKPRKKNKKS